MVKVGDGGEEEKERVRRGLEGIVEGVEVEGGLEGMEGWLENVCDLDVVRRNYKVGKVQGQGPGKKGGVVNGVRDGEGGEEDEKVRKERERREIERVVLGMMALRGAT